MTEHAHTLLGLNWWAWDPHRAPMGWFLLDFAIFVAALVYFAAGPLRQSMAERHESIRKAVTDAAAHHARATGAQQEWSRRLAALDNEIRELETASSQDGEAEIARMVAEARERADGVRTDSSLQVEQATRRAHERLRQQSLRNALQLAQVQLAAQITPDDQNRLLNEAIAAAQQSQDSFAAGTPREKLS